MRRAALALVSVLILAGCAGVPETPASVAGGTCKLPGLQTPEYVVKGKTRFDQLWADRVTEALVVGCLQERPKPRPPELDRPATASKVVASKKPARKPSAWDRLRRKPAAPDS